MKKQMPKPKNFDNLLKSSINAAESVESMEEQDMSFINDYLAEHLKSFILLGYDLKGESVVIVSGKNPQDYDAIETLLRRVSNIDFFKDIQEQTNTNE
jgi:hypothetical protein|tara:strand:+ start:17077 stop:17370 length:294 start_codon:yes stop_codon:yes gene_type:complete